MKRLLSILFLFVFLFNMGGCYIMYWGLRYQANKELQQKLDEGVYGENQTMTLTLPMALPYQIDRNFERVDGEFEYKGEFYKLVKQQLRRDTLYVVCVKDQREKELVSEMIEFTKLANDLPASSQTLKLFGSLCKDYTSNTSLELISHQVGWTAQVDFTTGSFQLISHTMPINSPPPRVA